MQNQEKPMHTAILSRKLTSYAAFGIFAFAALVVSMIPAQSYAATGALTIVDVTNESSAAKADNDFTHGFKYTFHVAIPANETLLKMKFSDWTSASGTIPAAGNVRIYSVDSTNATNQATAIVIPAANSFGAALSINPASASITASGHAHIVAEVRIPANTPVGSYAATYTIEALQNFNNNGQSGNGDDDVVISPDNGNGSSGNGDDDGHNGGHGTVTDTTAPTATVSYSKLTITNTNVEATITPSEAITVTNNGGSLTHTFTENGSFTFEFRDAAGNTGTAIATVSNIDKVGPEISIIGANPQAVVIGTEYIENGATANDAVSGSAAITIDSAEVKINEIGSYRVYYQAADSAGNTSTVFRTVNVVSAPDTTAPTATVAYSTLSLTKESVTATITPSEPVTVTNNSGSLSHVFTDNGSFTFEFTDASGNTGSATATVSNIDKVAPSIVLIGANPQTIALGAAYVELGATATDDRSPSLVTAIDSSSVNTAVIGSYTVTYSTSDEAGNNATLTRTVNVIEAPDTEAPTATVEYSTLAPTFNDVTAYLSPSEAVRMLNNSGRYTRTFSDNGSFTFEFEDAAGNKGSTTAVVTNIDRIAPTLMLNGDNPQMIALGTPYIELGATVTDNFPGVSVVTINSSTVNTSVAGEYYVSYSAVDVAGNSISSNRQVVVVGETKTITASSGANGTITPAGAVSVAKNSDKTFVVERAPGYLISDVIVDGVSTPIPGGNVTSVFGGNTYSYTFSNVTENHTISAVFQTNASDSRFIALAGDIADGIKFSENNLPGLPWLKPRTPEQIAAFRSVIDNAQAVYNNPMSTRQDVFVAHSSLIDAFDVFNLLDL